MALARSREFDVNEALDAAVGVLWERGYAATSVRQLCEAMGLQPGSFYAAFQSKDACFRRALERYTRTQLPKLEPGPAAIKRWLYAITTANRGSSGCLLVNSAVEAPLLQTDAKSDIRARLQALEVFFARCLDGRPDAREDAELLAATVVSIHVLARSGATPTKLRRIARRALAVTSVADHATVR